MRLGRGTATTIVMMAAMVALAHASLGPAWLSTRKAYGTHTELLAVVGGKYPTINIQVGEPSTRMAVSPRWDLPRTYVGYMGAQQLQTASLTLSDDRELFRLGGIEIMLPLAMGDAPPPVSPCDARECTAARRTRIARTEAWLDMSATSTLWRHWTAWSIGPARIILGAHRPHADRRHSGHEMLGSASQGIPVRVRNITTTMLFDLNCDFTYVPHAVYVGILNHHDAVDVCSDATGHCFHLPTRREQVDVIRDSRYCNDTLVIGRIHAQRFIVGQSLTRDELSVVPLDLIGPPVDSVDHLVWFGVLLALLCTWLLAIYPGAYRALCVRMLVTYGGGGGGDSDDDHDDDASVFDSENGAIVESLVLFTALAVLSVACVVVWGYRLDLLLNIDLPQAYTRVVVWMAIGVALLSLAWPMLDADPNNVQLLVFHMCNALRVSTWLFAALRYDMWLMQVVMLFIAGIGSIRSGEQLLQVFMARRGDVDGALVARRWVWIVYFGIVWALSVWLFGGYTIPMLVDTWWATLVFRVEISLAIGLVVAVWLPVYFVVKHTLYRASLQLSLYTAAAAGQ